VLVRGEQPLQQRLVGHVRVLAGSARDNDDIGPLDVGQGGIGDQAQGALLVHHRAGRMRGEDDFRARQAAEDVIGADGVQRREPVEQHDGDKHDPSLLV
jgi:hypothetical protein